MPEFKNYTAKDIEMYHAGQMPPAEMHALEKAALDDPFLADALEGYTYTTTAGDDIAKISARLNERTNRGKVIPLFFKKNNWLKYAAMFLIIAGGGFIIYQSVNKKTDSLALQNTNKEVQQIAPSKQAADSSITTTAPDIEKPSVTENDNDSKQLDQVTSIPKSKKEKEIITQQEPAKTTTTSSELVVNNDEYKKKNEASKTMTLVNPSPVMTDSSSRGILSMGKKDFGATKGINDTVHLNDVVMEKMPNQQLEEVVVGYGTRKNTRILKPQVIVDTLEPAEGWSYFNNYITENIQIPDELRNKPTPGDVELSFDVDKDGMPTNIAVLRSLCSKCDEEAIRLLKDGPKWRKKRNKKGKVTIHF